MGRKRKNPRQVMSKRFIGQEVGGNNEISQELEEQNIDSQLYTQPAVLTSQPDHLVWGQKRRNSGQARLERFRAEQGGDSTEIAQELEQQNITSQLRTEHPDINMATPSRMVQKRKNAGQEMLERAQEQEGGNNRDFYEELQQIINSRHHTQLTGVNISTPPSSDDSLGIGLNVEQNPKNLGQSILKTLQRQQSGNNHENSGEVQMQNINSQLDTQCPNVNVTTPASSDNNTESSSRPSETRPQHANAVITTPALGDDNSQSSSRPNETQSQRKEDSLGVKIIDTSTGIIMTQRMQPHQVWHLEKNKKVLVEINGNGQGNDSGANLLVRFLGQLAQKSTICPISVETWRRMPMDKRCQQWKYIEDHFEFDYAAGVKWVMTTLGERWRDHKYNLRRKYSFSNKSKEELLANPPIGVDSAEWTAFVHHYKDKRMKMMSVQNRINAKKQKVLYACGSMSHARRARQMEQQLGRPVCRSELILATLKKKDGSYVTEEAKLFADKIAERLPQDRERVARLGVPSTILAHPNDAIGKVCGLEHSGRVRGVGTGIPRSSIYRMPRDPIDDEDIGGSSNSNDVDKERIQDLEKQVETLKEKLTGYDETKAQLAKLHKFLQDKFGGEVPL